MSGTVLSKSEVFASLPEIKPVATRFADIKKAVQNSGRKVVVLDDDPTGSQTVHGIYVLTGWQVEELEKALRSPEDVFYILTNTRSLQEDKARALNEDVARNLCAASKNCGVRFDIISRSDSTLRGHYPLELDVLEEVLEQQEGLRFDGHLLIPAFFEGGRFTINNIHYVQEGDRLTPAEETEFANDAVFGYRNSYMPRYVEEKTSGKISAADVICISIDDLRVDGSERVSEILKSAPRGSRIVVNAADYSDLEVFVLGLLKAEAAGKHYLVRSSASFVKVRGAITPKRYLTRNEIAPAAENTHGGLVVVGSYVGKTTSQVEAAEKLSNLKTLEINVNLLLEEKSRQEEIGRVTNRVQTCLQTGQDIMIYTSRVLVKQAGDLVNLDIGEKVSSALVRIVESLQVQPRFLIAKGGITSSDLATDALKVRSALVIGQVAPGISVWRLKEETRFPGMAYVVFPGNVGSAETLADVVKLLDGQIERLG